MAGLARHMAKYASHHQHPVNRALHAVGIPAIVASLVLLLALVPSPVGWPLWPAVAVAAAGAWYLRLDLAIGAVTTLAIAGLVVAAHFVVSAWGMAVLPWALAVHAAAWAVQFLGHGVWEKRRPALFDNITQSLVAPLFLVAEAAFLLGLRRELRREVEPARA